MWEWMFDSARGVVKALAMFHILLIFRGTRLVRNKESTRMLRIKDWPTHGGGRYFQIWGLKGLVGMRDI